eukprot:CAMPEP_0202864470 /NCGR_PEP_ID=MMETSP1391-20130828/4698_1 /ASSEMBLY_ACC=CAM_ASM_000867 /TAXON_ID=1034604 /ORGANISM="Chlamydomonas leiostraca, Strain SAG 11-49" /LENGTH=364 /DNA_ID=CAMNT_0049544211 /DNA_START=27 /DNA_END=1121 /DNA_ORIENTATION=-
MATSSPLGSGCWVGRWQGDQFCVLNRARARAGPDISVCKRVEKAYESLVATVAKKPGVGNNASAVSLLKGCLVRIEGKVRIEDKGKSIGRTRRDVLITMRKGGVEHTARSSLQAAGYVTLTKPSPRGNATGSKRPAPMAPPADGGERPSKRTSQRAPAGNSPGGASGDTTPNRRARPPPARAGNNGGEQQEPQQQGEAGGAPLPGSAGRRPTSPRPAAAANNAARGGLPQGRAAPGVAAAGLLAAAAAQGGAQVVMQQPEVVPLGSLLLIPLRLPASFDQMPDPQTVSNAVHGVDSMLTFLRCNDDVKDAVFDAMVAMRQRSTVEYNTFLAERYTRCAKAWAELDEDTIRAMLRAQFPQIPAHR